MLSSASPAASLANIEPVVLRHLGVELGQFGIDPDAVFQGAGFTTQQLADTAFRVSYRQASHCIQRALHLLDDPHLGLRLGTRVNLVSWGAAYVGLLACADSHAMLDFAARYLPSAAGLLQLRFEHAANGPSIAAQARFDDPLVSQFLVEKAFAALALTCTQVVKQSYGPLLVHLTIAPPGRAALHARALSCDVQFGQAENRMYFPLESAAIGSADAVVLQKMQQALSGGGGHVRHGGHGRRDSATQFPHPLETSVAQALQTSLDAPLKLAVVAAALHMSERTLRRRLAELGLGFQELLDRERRRQALDLIQVRRMPLSQVAVATGFSDVRSLRRAVRRWTGRSPSELKRLI